jgi:peptidoglycan/xylan/chitin deacetylase (PgdA/CDA1 family)
MKTYIVGLSTIILIVCLIDTSLANTGYLMTAQPSSNVTVNVACDKRGYVSFEFDDGNQDQFDYAFPILQAYGIKATFMVCTEYINGYFPSWQGGDQCMTDSELRTLQAAGMEIGSHSVSHNSFLYDTTNVLVELRDSKQALQNWGINCNNFAYPAGYRSDATDEIAEQYYHSATGGYEGYYVVPLPVNQFHLPIDQGDMGYSNDLERCKAMVDEAYNLGCWELISFHNVGPYSSSLNYMNTATFTALLDYINSLGVTVVTVEEGLNLTR